MWYDMGERKMMVLKIVVLAGGLSTERAVSLVTGVGVCRALRENGHRAVLADLYLGLEDIPEDLESLFDAPDGLCPEARIDAEAPDLEAVRKSRRDQSARVFGPNVLELCQLADVVFVGLHGQDGEDGRVQAAFDLLGIPYTGSGYLAAGVSMSKVMTKRVMDAEGLPTPEWKLLQYKAEDAPKLAAELPMPCVVKTPAGGSSLGVFLPEDRKALEDALVKALEFGPEVLIEKRIYGRELTVGVLGDKALPPLEVLPAGGEFDYAAKYQAGGAQEVLVEGITEEQQKEMGELALRLHRALGMEVYSRTDFILDSDGKFWILELNSLPGMTPGSLVPKMAKAAGMSYNQLCEEIITQSLALKRR